jgi:hypothetical protein
MGFFNLQRLWLAVLLCAGMEAMGQTNWTRRTPQPPIAPLYGIAASGNRCVTVGGYGILLTSGDAVSWEDKTFDPSLWLYSVTWTGTRFVAVGARGRIATSRDGSTWAASDISDTAAVLYSVIWTDTQLVAVGNGGKIYASADGTNWSKKTSATSKTLRSVCWNGKKLLAVGDSGVIISSTDGTTWTNHSADSSGNLNSVVWTGTGYVAVGGDIYWSPGAPVPPYGYQGYFSKEITWTSPDGNTWAKIAGSFFVGSQYGLRGVTRTGSRLFAVGYSDSVLSSTDGMSWTGQSCGTSRVLNSICVFGSKIVAAGEGGIIVTSTDGNTWGRMTPISVPDLRAAVTSGTTVVVAGDSGRIFTSPDAVTWTKQSSGMTTSLRALAWSGAFFIAVGDSGTVITSTDGTAWARKSSGATDTLFGIAWTGSRFVAVGEKATILVSPDANAWSRVVVDSLSVTLHAILSTPGKLVAVGGYGTIISSANGTNWTKKTSGVAGNLYAIAFSGTRFAVSGWLLKSYVDWRTSPQSVFYYYCRDIAISDDGDTWKAVLNADNGNGFNSIVWDGKQFAAFGNYQLFTSPDGTAWNNKTSSLTWDVWAADFNSVCWTGTRYVAAGTDDAIFTALQDGTIQVVSAPEKPGAVHEFGMRLSGNEAMAFFPDKCRGGKGDISVYSLSGRKVLSFTKAAVDGTCSFSIRSLAAGAYQFVFVTKTETMKRTFTVLR